MSFEFHTVSLQCLIEKIKKLKACCKTGFFYFLKITHHLIFMVFRKPEIIKILKFKKNKN